MRNPSISVGVSVEEYLRLRDEAKRNHITIRQQLSDDLNMLHLSTPLPESMVEI